jgi:hypothetical protein
MKRDETSSDRVVREAIPISGIAVNPAKRPKRSICSPPAGTIDGVDTFAMGLQ